MERLLTLYSEVQSTDVRWLWYPFIAIGKITLLQGDPGDGKSTMMMNLIAELSTGGKTPDGCKIGAPQKVIYQCSEDGVSDTIKPRLERCGADCRKIAFINEEVYNGLLFYVLSVSVQVHESRRFPERSVPAPCFFLPFYKFLLQVPPTSTSKDHPVHAELHFCSELHQSWDFLRLGQIPSHH